MNNTTILNSSTLITMILPLIVLAVVLLTTWRIVRWTSNYLEARSYGLPIILLPVSFNEPLWMVFRPLFAWVEYLPFGLGNWYLYTTMGWPTEDGTRSVELYGESFVLCSPVDNIISTCEPAGLKRVWTEPRDIWRMPESQSQLFAFFGQNVSSTHGEDWKRHRKITVPVFTERMMASVWKEARHYTEAIKLTLEKESEKSVGGIRTMFDVLAMKVLTVVAFGQESELTTVPTGHKLSLMESMEFILKHILLTAVFNSLKAPDLLLPRVLRKLKLSVTELRLHMQEIVHAHMQSASTSTSKPAATGFRATSLIEAMVTANELEKQGATDGKGRAHLTDSELYGNIFVYSLGGYETTASTLAFALPFLALHPDIQDWVHSELSTYTTSKQSKQNLEQEPELKPDSALDYATVFPNLPRTLALMHETLRLASPSPLFVKTPLLPIDLDITTPSGLKTVTVKPGTLVGMNQYGAHLSPRWGPDAATFNPKRFIVSDPSAKGGEKFQLPEGPMFCAWQIGGRMCPAKKFSQVEFAGIMSALLSERRVELLKEERESEEQARERVGRVLASEKYFMVSAKLKRPEAVGVRFVKR